MKQELLFPDFEIYHRPYPKAVNVASVPQRSPFRYPGGKTWFVPAFRKWIASMPSQPQLLVEPFAGGGIISLTALFEKLVQKAIMVERDEEIAAVWQSVVNGDAGWLADRILEFKLTKENVQSEINAHYNDIKHIAFQTILKNRTLHGGILFEGSSFIKYGENGKGIRSSLYPKTLAVRFRNFDFVASRIKFICGDGLQVLRDYADNKDAVFFIDPPYTAGGKKAGSRLYKYYELDHEYLFKLCESLQGDFIMTYDMADEVKNLAKKHGFEMKPIAMKSTHHAEMTELVIGRDLSWMSDTSMIREKRVVYKTKKHL
ncbi:DNA adenine methylase [bacterium]|nr:DNA adenine methylase [bacterium]